MSKGKIPKMDHRFSMMEQLFDLRKRCIQEGFYKDGTFRYALFIPEKNKHHSFSLHILPNLFIEYIFANIRTLVQNNIKYWLQDGKIEKHDYINGAWTTTLIRPSRPLPSSLDNPDLNHASLIGNN